MQRDDDYRPRRVVSQQHISRINACVSCTRRRVVECVGRGKGRRDAEREEQPVEMDVHFRPEVREKLPLIRNPNGSPRR